MRSMSVYKVALFLLMVCMTVALFMTVVQLFDISLPRPGESVWKIPSFLSSIFRKSGITPSSSDAYNYEYQNSVLGTNKIRFTEKASGMPAVSIGDDHASITLRYVPRSRSERSTYETRTSGNTITYRDIEPHTNLIYTVNDTGTAVKEDIEVTQRPELKEGEDLSYAFDIVLRGLDYTASPDGTVPPVFTDSKGTRYTIPPLVMSDKNGATSTALTFVLTQVNANNPNILRGILTPNNEWVTSIDRKFPVLIDPTITWSKANWFDEHWRYRQSVSITNGSGGVLTDYQVPFTLDTAALVTDGKMLANCNDMRVTDVNGTLIPFWIETSNPGCNNASTKIWVKPKTLATTENVIFVYYGNEQATNVENGEMVFEFFDDFSNGLSKWKNHNNPSNVAVAGGYVEFTGGSVVGPYGWTALGSDWNAFQDGIIEGRIYLATATIAEVGFRGDYGANTGYKSRMDSRTGTGLLHEKPPYASWAALTSCTVSGTAMSVDTWLPFKITAVGTSFTIDADTQTKTCTDATYTAAGEISLQSHYGAYTRYDDIRVRKYAATEPTAGTPSSEELSPGPIAYWKLDEGANNTCAGGTKDVCDASNQGHDGDAYGTPVRVGEDMCVNGKCLKLDGDDYVIAGTGPDYFPMTTFAMCSWVKTPGMASTESSMQGIISMTFGLTLSLDPNGQVFSRAYNGSTIISRLTPVNLNDNKWHHVCFTHDGTNRYIYVDGNLKDTYASTWTGDPGYTSGVDIGCEANDCANRQFNGFIDEVKVYPYLRTSDQIKSDYLSRGSTNSVAAQFGKSEKTSGLGLSNGLVGYWKLDESSGAATDSSGNAHTLTDASATTFAAGKYGNGADLESGSTDYQYIADNAALSITASTSISAWIKPESVTAATLFDIAGKWDGADESYRLAQYGDEIRFNVDSNTNYVMTDAANLAAGTWYHIAASYNAQTASATIMVNGAIQASTVSGTIPTSIGDDAGRFHIGAEDSTAGANSYYDGIIDEVRLYNRAITESEARSLHAFAAPPVAYWNFDENTGTTIYDRSGNANNAALTNGPTYAPGKFGGSLKFDGSDDTMTISDATSLKPSYITIQGWIKRSALANAAYPIPIFKENFASGKGYLFGDYSGSNDLFGCRLNGGTDVTNGQLQETTATYDAWVHYACTFDGTTIRLYKNGILVNSKTPSFSVISHDTTAIVNATSYLGSIDDVKIYDYPRTAAQIIEDMNGGHPAPGSPIGSAVGHWKFDEGYGTTAFNSGNAGTSQNGTVSGATWTNAGKYGRALSFDGTADNVAISPIAFGPQFTWMHWIKTSSTASGMYTIGNSFSGDGYRFGINAGRIRFLAGSGLYTEAYCGNRTVNDDAWHHIVGVFDSTNSTFTCYIDGTYEATVATVDFSAMQTSATPGIGAPPCCTDYSGLIDEVKAYNLGLNADQVKAEYNAGKAQVMGSLSTASNGITADNSASREYCVPGDTGTCNAPVGEWKFDENTGTTSVYDTSGNNFTGTLNGAMTSDDWVAGKQGSALDFDGTDDYVSVTGLLGSPSNVTLSAWVNLDAQDTAGAEVISLGDSVALRIENSQVWGWYYNGTTWPGLSYATTMQGTGWHHLLYTFDDTNNLQKLYLDGVLVNSGTEATSISYTVGPNAIIGKHGNGGTTVDYNGKIDGVRVYNYVRTPAQVAWEYNRGKPALWYRMDECTGTTINDASGSANSGTLTIGGSGTNTAVGTCSTSGAWYDGATGKTNSSMDFDGTDDYVSSSYVYPNTAFTLSAWIKRTGTLDLTYGFAGVVGLRNSTEMQRGIQITSGNMIQTRDYQGTNTNISSGVTADLDVWRHVVLAYDGTTQSLYVDGILRNSSTPTYSNNAVTALQIGAINWGVNPNRSFNGQIDDVRIFTYGLNAAQVRDVYNGAAVSFR